VAAGNSAMLPVQAAVYTTLAADAALGALLETDAGAGVQTAPRIYDEVPQSVDIFPYVQVGEAIESKDNTFSETGRSVVVAVHIYSQAQGWKEAQGILEEVVRLLDEVLLTNIAAPWTIWDNNYDPGGMEQRDPDGTRHIVARFTIRVQRPGH
jgi:hypothetical protein